MCVAVAAAVGLVAGCSSGGSSGSPSSSGSASANSPFNVLVVAGTTGANSIQGLADQEGMRAAASYVNANGGILGHQVKVNLVNDNGDPTTAASVLLSYLTSHSDVDAVVPGGESNETAALLPILSSHGILALAQEDGGLTDDLTSNASKFPQQFVVTTPPSLNSAALAKYIVDQHFKHVGILKENVAYFDSEMAGLSGPLSKAGIQSTVVPFDPTALDLTAEASKLQAAHVDAVLVAAVGPSAGYALTAISKVGLNVPKIGDAGIASTPVTTLVPKADYEGMKTVYFRVEVYVPPAQQSPALKSFLAALNAENAKMTAPFVFYASMWDDLMLLRHAAKQAGSVDDAALVQALNNLQTTSDPNYIYEANYKYSPTDHENSGASLRDLEVAKVGPIINGQVHPG
jgi:branched-chain amino acid transport system substrate-binding protein